MVDFTIIGNAGLNRASCMSMAHLVRSAMEFNIIALSAF